MTLKISATKRTLGPEGQRSNKRIKTIPVKADYHGFDRTEVTRLLTQALYDLYPDIASQLERASGTEQEGRFAKELRQIVLSGEWEQAEQMVQTLNVDRTAFDEMVFAIRRQQYLELVEMGNVTAALDYLRMNLATISKFKVHTNKLSRAVVLGKADLYKVMNWQGKAGGSRLALLDQLFQHFSPTEILPAKRLAHLLTQVKLQQTLNKKYYMADSDYSLCRDYSTNKNRFPRKTVQVLDGHSSEVWSIQFSPSGKLLAAGEANGNIVIWRYNNNNNNRGGFEKLTMLDEHIKGISSLSWMDEHTLASCSHDQTCNIWNVDETRLVQTLQKNTDVVSCCGWINGGRLITSSPDQKLILWTRDFEVEFEWNKQRIMQFALTADEMFLVGLSEEQCIHVYDLTSRKQVRQITVNKRLTGITISSDSKYALVNIEPNEVLMYELDTGRLARRFVGYIQNEFYIRSCFGGLEEQFVLSGSEDDRVYVWNRHTGDPIEQLEGHEGLVNVVQWVPNETAMFASASDDHTVRIWGV